MNFKNKIIKIIEFYILSDDSRERSLFSIF